VVKAFPGLRLLRRELKRNQAETEAMLAGLPEVFVSRKRSYWRLGYTILMRKYHYEDNLAQIKDLLTDPATHDGGDI